MTPRECAAAAAPVFVDDALAKRITAVLAKQHADRELLTCLKDLQQALAGSRGVVATLRANYQETYDISEGWRRKYLSVVDGRADDSRADELTNAAAALAACEDFQQKQRLQIQALQQQLKAAEAAAKEAGARERTAAERERSTRQLLGSVQEELASEQRARAAQSAAAQAAAAEVLDKLAEQSAEDEAAQRRVRGKLAAAEAKVHSPRGARTFDGLPRWPSTAFHAGLQWPSTLAFRWPSTLAFRWPSTLAFDGLPLPFR